MAGPAASAVLQGRGQSAGTTKLTGARLALVLMVALVVAGVGAWAWSEAIWPLNQGSARALERRAQEYWDLQVAGDKFGAYQYLAESYRKRVTPSAFSTEGSSIVWTSAQLKKVQLDGSSAQIELNLKYRFLHPKYDFGTAETNSNERWVFENGGWYRWPPGLGG